MAHLQQFKDDFILFLESGFIAAHLADEDGAMKLFRASQLLRPDSMMPKIGQGYVHLLKLELKQATSLFDQVLHADPNNQMARALLGLSTAFTTKEVDKGEKLLEEALKKTDDPTVKNMAKTSIEFIHKYVKKAPTPMQGKTETKKKRLRMTSKPDATPPLDPTRRIGEEQKQEGGMQGPPGRSFEQYMEKAARPPPPGSGQPGEVSPFDLIQGKTTLAGGPSFDTLLNQVKSAQSMLGDLNNQLNTKNLKLKQSQRYLLRNKLTDANTHLRKANAKMGAETPEPPQATAGGGIMGKFMNLVAEGQANVMAAQQQLVNLKGKGDSLKPADFLVMQVQLAHAQQEIEYASIMLSKSIDDMKMMFNIQL